MNNRGIYLASVLAIILSSILVWLIVDSQEKSRIILRLESEINSEEINLSNNLNGLTEYIESYTECMQGLEALEYSKLKKRDCE